MHDPEVVAFTVNLPWPGNGYRQLKRRNPAKRHRWASKPLLTVWHVEPGGHDALEVCGRTPVKWLGKRTGRGGWRMYWWKLHVHHWSLQFPPLQALRRRLLTRCAWCGGRDRKGDPVNHSHQWEPARRRWWQGETHLFHGDCSTVQSAHQKCLCPTPMLQNRDHGRCGLCGKFRGWRDEPTIPDHYLAALPKGARIPPEKKDWLKAEWAKIRAEREAQSNA